MKRLDTAAPGWRAALRAFTGEGAPDPAVTARVAEILGAIRVGGDAALVDWIARVDRRRVAPADLRVPAETLAAAARDLAPGRRALIQEAVASVRAFHERGRPAAWRGPNLHGAEVGERWDPLRRVGCYIPGGAVPLVSTVVMTCVPAAVAGVPEIVACSPVQADGEIDRHVLAALWLCGVREVYRMGGPMAAAALAYGTETIPAVVKLVGPGNAYVTEAKRQLCGVVGIDGLPGPSEVVIAASADANPAWIAADLLAQAEHGSGWERVAAVSEAPALLDAVAAEIARQLPALAHREAIAKVLPEGCALIRTHRREETAEVLNLLCPEHLELHFPEAESEALAAAVTTAGAVFLGPWTPTVLGDFAAGPSHTLPTAGTGRFASGLKLDDFLRRTSLVRYGPASLPRAAAVVAEFAAMERLDAHGRSLTIRLAGD